MTKQSFLRWLVYNPGWRLLSLVLAVVIWMNVATEPEMSTLMSVPIQFKDPPDTLEVMTRAHENVQLEVRGSSGQLRDLPNSRPVITFDFSGVREPGDRTFNITRSETNLPRTLELIRAVPAQVRFRFERSEHRSVPVTVQFQGSPGSGLRVASARVDPPIEQIVGPQSRVRTVKEALTDPIDLTSLNPAHPVVSTNVYLTDPNVRLVSSPRVTVTMVVK